MVLLASWGSLFVIDLMGGGMNVDSPSDVHGESRDPWCIVFSIGIFGWGVGFLGRDRYLVVGARQIVQGLFYP